MKNKMRLAVALGAVVALWAGVARADFNVLDHFTWYGNASTGLKVDVNGNLTTVDPDRDRDFPTFINLFSSASLGVNGTYQMNSPKYVGQFSRAVLMFNYVGAAAADSDSVALVIRVYGRTSLNSGNRYLWTPMSGSFGAGDTCYTNSVAADSLTSSGRCLLPSPSFVISRAVGYPRYVHGQFVGLAAAANQRAFLRKIPGYALRMGGANGAMLVLADCPFPYIEVEVQNLNWSRAFTVSCDVWPRVN